MSATVRRWLAYPLPPDVARALGVTAGLPDVRHVVVLPDVHLASDVCIGTVVATAKSLYPAAVGSDIGCGMAAVRFDATAEVLADECAAARVLDGLGRVVPIHRQPSARLLPALPEELATLALSDPRLEKEKHRDGRVQFGTLGRGNHFLELQKDAEGAIWLLVHCGSRGIGEAIARHHLARATAGPVGLRSLDADSDRGRAYLADHRWAVRYAELGRLAIVDAVVALLQDLFGVAADRSTLFQADHNHVRRETHSAEDLWVHRKGALFAGEGEPGAIPGSMGTLTFHVEGRGSLDSLASCSHGAGRAMSRTEARRSIGLRRLLSETRGVWFDHRRADALREEAPSAYKDLRSVMRAQKDLVRIVRELRPILCYKGA